MNRSRARWKTCWGRMGDEMTTKNGGRGGNHRRSWRVGSRSDVVGDATHSEPPTKRRGGTSKVPLETLIAYCRTHSQRQAAKHFGLTSASVSERLRRAGVSKLLQDSVKSQAAVARIGSELEQLDTIRADTFALAVDIVQRIKKGEFVFLEEREFALRALHAEAHQHAISSTVAEKMYQIKNTRIIMDDLVEAIRCCSEPTRRELHDRMLRRAAIRGLFDPNRPFAGLVGRPDGGETSDAFPGGAACHTP